MENAEAAVKSRLRLSLKAWKRLASKIDPKRARGNWRTRFLYEISGAFNSLLSGIQRESHAHVLESTAPKAPIFILGFWRSGTTFLHELLCCDSQFGFPSTYACLNPCHFLLSEKKMHRSSFEVHTRRPMDNLLYSWSSPQEDEFALLALGAPSPYDALLVPSLMRDPAGLLDLSRSAAAEQACWSTSLRYFLQLLTVQQGDKTLLLKSPSHGFRFSRLRTLFPQARYIIIERHPYEVFASNLKLWHVLLDMYSLEDFLGDEIEQFVLDAYVLHERSISDGALDLDRRFVSRIRYEDLVANPLKELERLYAELQLGAFEAARPNLEQHLTKVKNYKPNLHNLSPAQKDRVDMRWASIISAKGYHCSDDLDGCWETSATTTS